METPVETRPGLNAVAFLRRWWFALAALPLVAALSDCSSSPKPTGSGCKFNGDCAKGQACLAGVCGGTASGTDGGTTDAGPVSSTKTCSGDVDCEQYAATPRCDTTNKVCVRCILDNECAPGQSCTAGACTGAQPECTTGSQCTTAQKPYCDQSAGKCVECTAPSQCGAQQTCSGGLCVTSPGGGCTSDADCAASATATKCDPNAGCVQCVADTDCATGQTCTANTCSGGGTGGLPFCFSDAMCTPPDVCVLASPMFPIGTCGTGTPGGGDGGTPTGGCQSAVDCTTDPNAQACDTSSGQCVQCVLNDDCKFTPSTPVCLPVAFTCVQCAQDTDCTPPDGGVPHQCDTTTYTCR